MPTRYSKYYDYGFDLRLVFSTVLYCTVLYSIIHNLVIMWLVLAVDG